MRFAGQRPEAFGSFSMTGVSPSEKNLTDPNPVVLRAFHGSPATRHPSMLRAPTPQRKTFAATVGSLSGFRAMQIGSHAGLRAVPQPDQRMASGVDGAVSFGT